jgi:hypothetical protein
LNNPNVVSLLSSLGSTIDRVNSNILIILSLSWMNNNCNMNIIICSN